MCYILLAAQMEPLYCSLHFIAPPPVRPTAPAAGRRGRGGGDAAVAEHGPGRRQHRRRPHGGLAHRVAV